MAGVQHIRGFIIMHYINPLLTLTLAYSESWRRHYIGWSWRTLD